jgi:type IV secretory pathway VirB6-like protein
MWQKKVIIFLSLCILVACALKPRRSVGVREGAKSKIKNPFNKKLGNTLLKGINDTKTTLMQNKAISTVVNAGMYATTKVTDFAFDAAKSTACNMVKGKQRAECIARLNEGKNMKNYGLSKASGYLNRPAKVPPPPPTKYTQELVGNMQNLFNNYNHDNPPFHVPP